VHDEIDPPWEGVFRISAFFFDRALRKSIPAGHVLADRRWTAIARDKESDDVLFSSEDGKIAKVHLTYKVENDPQFPTTTFYTSVADFLIWLKEEQAFVAALLDEVYPTHSCSNCGSNWSEGRSGLGCQTCGGFGLQRPCPICGGICGAMWNRSILDSVDTGEAHWVGVCRHKNGP
jgi:hypothetical protein